MSKIEQLAIQGIRSFDNTRREAIHFNTPLTLIVGYNGSGKTTIIECLKYATTGILPPNSKTGGAFIHDPKLVGEKEVLAMVKLSFRSPNGARLVLSRRLQVTAKKTGPSASKTLEGSLMVIKEGERSSLSSKNTELDTLMPQYLGVSKAVLDSVIFCHQDESLWPMSEPTTLKKKFDHIFEALKYTKAIENIKELGKTQKNSLSNWKIREENAKTNKAKADQNAKRSNELLTQIEQLREEVEKFNDQAKEAAEQSEKARDKAARYKGDVETLKSQRKAREMLEDMVNRVLQSLEARSETDEWLRNELNQYAERMAAHTEREQKQREVYQGLQRGFDAAQARLKQKYNEEGRHNADKASHEQLVESRSKMIREKASRHSIRGYDHDLDDEEIDAFMKRITKLLKDQKLSVDKVRNETEVEVQHVQRALDGLREHRSGLIQSKKSSKERTLANDSRIESSRSSLKRLKVDVGGVALLESNIQDLGTHLKQAKEAVKSGSWDSDLQKASIDLRLSEDKQKLLAKESAQVSLKAGELASLELLRKELTNTQRRLETMKGAHRNRIRKLIGHDWSASNIQGKYQNVAQNRENELKEASILRDSVARKHDSVEDRLRSLRADLTKGEKEQAKCVRYIKDKIDVAPEEFPHFLQEYQENRDVFKSDSDSFAAEQNFFAKCLDTANKHEACRLCERPFHKADEKGRFIQKLQGLLAKQHKEVENDLINAEDELRRAKDASPSHTTWSRLHHTELPRIQEDIKKLEVERNGLVGQIEEHDRTVADRQQSKADVDTLADPVKEIHELNQTVQKYKSEAQELAEKQKDAGLSRTVEDIHTEVKLASEKSESLRAKITELRDERDAARSKVRDLELELSTANNNLTVSNHDLEKKADLERQIEELQRNNEDAREAAKQFNLQIAELEPLIAEEETKLADVKKRGLNREKLLQEEAAGLSDSVHQLEMTSQQIRTYIDDGGPGKLAACKREIESTEQESKQLQNEQTQVTKELNKIRNELQSQKETRRNIEDNIDYRSHRQRLNAVKAEIAKLEAANAEADLEHHTRTYEHWDQEGTKFRTSAERRHAAMAAKDENLQELIDEFNQSYADAATEFKKCHITVETTKAAIEDLDRYAKALDKAIMKFHSIKMEEINRIIEELWRRTYQGTDVDSILIRSDGGSASGNRTYNYRVCMVKSDVEMDMRGRCSAGQKVLASIIIRLALAECFGVNCGLIALDEPTTNLDRDNIRSLAESLHDIIRARQQQANFQLIVITHDEEFLKFMKCADFCDDYYRVSRDDRQKSKIEKQSIGMVL